MTYQGNFSQSRNAGEDPGAQAEAMKPEAIMPEPEAPAVSEASTRKPAPEKASRNSPARQGGRKKRRKKKANRTLTLIFYTVYFVMVPAIIGGLFFLNASLEDWLVRYEASQSATRVDEIFREYFAEPNWAALYQMAGLSDTDYEGSDAFAAYMENKVGTGKLTYAETAPTLSGSHEYLLKLGDETLGCFTLVDQASDDSGLADWQLGQVRLSRICSESVTVQSVGNVTVYINGVALTDEHTIRISEPVSEAYLPDGVHSPRIYTRYLNGLLVTPEVTAADEEGNPLEVFFDTESGIYTVRTEETIFSDEEYDLILNTAKACGLFMLRQTSAQKLASYFDLRSEAYRAILSSTPWTQEKISGFAWGEARISDYLRCSDSLFCAHLELPVLVTCADGSQKEFAVAHSFFFEEKAGVRKCVGMTDADIRQQAELVRLTFQTGSSVIFTNMFSDDVSSLVLPTITAPEGQVFTGWYRLDITADGTNLYTRVFAPGEDDVITLPQGTKLEPMTLYALFEAVE